ncbi:NAD(P)-dependent oxidoreductase [Streptomyces roseoverticillatus]|uniref:NAD(P)-dependent oxidoreductase n=1 Tax=Streptomyces roseoverticillatus TaxID=66429 RepID=UPI001F1778E0|nr:NAD(P)-dependent oxidoreductase [Streptomyces roseoverticillatus]MCF3104497.1 NAD(P)-dependent oxidoreductase [Streptomyces roseoverticillatus]
MTTLGILHPGSMGAAVAAQAKARGAEVLWSPAGRSAATKARADEAGFTPASSLGELVQRSDVILSLCPPASAEEVAASVAAEAFSGIYVDANAISPASMAMISVILMRTDAQLVDGSVIGSPPSTAKTTRLYLSGAGAAVQTVAELFEGTAVHAHVLEGDIGKASALKLSYSTFQKTSRILAAVSYALAHDWGVEEDLLDIARGRTTSYLTEIDYFPKVAARAWRWAPEMREAESALGETCLPTELVEAAAAVMERWGDAKDLPMDLPEALTRLHRVLD